MTRTIALWATAIGMIASVFNLVHVWRWEPWAIQMATGLTGATTLLILFVYFWFRVFPLPDSPPRPEDPAVRGRQRRAWSIAALGCGLAAVACVAASALNPVFRVVGFVLLVFTALNTWRAWTLREREPASV